VDTAVTQAPNRTQAGDRAGLKTPQNATKNGLSWGCPNNCLGDTILRGLPSGFKHRLLRNIPQTDSCSRICGANKVVCRNKKF